MDTVMIRSGRVVPLIGALTKDETGTVSGYTGGATTNTSGPVVYKDSPWSYFQAKISGTGAVSATVTIYGSNDGLNFSTTALATLSLSGTTSHVDGAAYVGPCKYVKATITSISGTGATVVATMGI